ncbi:MAG TPA: response regulator [Aestuariivirga sp.]|nr:response regulator [Aestuariivirga sp.]
MPFRRAVIIEDDPDFADRLTSLLASLGHLVVVRLDSSASETYEIRDTDIVFLDLLMPRVSGVQVLEQLERQNAKSPIVLMNGNEHFLREAEETINKLHLWHLGTLYKPFILADVKALLDGV